MTTLLVVATLVAGAGVTVDLPPATALALDLAETIGATVQKIAVVPDGTVTDDERDAILDALERTELFELVDPAQVSVVIAIKRIDPSVLLITATDPSGKRLWVGRAIWAAGPPPEPPAPEPTADAGSATSEETYRSLLRFERERLRVVSVARSYVGIPVLLGDDPAPQQLWQADPAARWDAGRPVGGSAVVWSDWSVVRGSAQLVTDMELAQLLENWRLVERIETTRFWPRLFWVAGFGLGAVAGVTTGAYLAQSDDRDTHNVGISLVAVGAVSGVLALLFPTVGAKHVLAPGEAQTYCDEYNERLRKELALTPTDLAAHADDERLDSGGD